jgi:predicted HTH transcriptional regulator
VGVGKDREPEAEKSLKRVLQSDKPEALTDYMKHLDEVIRERVKPVPFIRVESVHLLGRQVIVITVESGRDKPYSTVPGSDVFIRSGAANRRPDPKTELPRLYESTGIHFPAVHPWSRSPV